MANCQTIDSLHLSRNEDAKARKVSLPGKREPVQVLLCHTLFKEHLQLLLFVFQQQSEVSLKAWLRVNRIIHTVMAPVLLIGRLPAANKASRDKVENSSME